MCPIISSAKLHSKKNWKKFDKKKYMHPYLLMSKLKICGFKEFDIRCITIHTCAQFSSNPFRPILFIRLGLDENRLDQNELTKSRSTLYTSHTTWTLKDHTFITKQKCVHFRYEVVYFFLSVHFLMHSYGMKMCCKGPVSSGVPQFQYLILLLSEYL